MTSQDWNECLDEWERSFDNFQPVHLLPPTPSDRMQEVKYIKRGFKSKRAQFYLTENGIAGNFGFWVPKKIVESDDGLIVKIPSWFKVKIIQID